MDFSAKYIFSGEFLFDFLKETVISSVKISFDTSYKCIFFF